jgi:raffinose/stachyose/melibiose transport system permease protein
MRQSRPAWSRGFGLFLIPGAVTLLVIIILPLAANIGISFTRWTGVGMPRWIGLENFKRAFGDGVFWASFRNNLAMIGAVTVVPTIVGLLLAVFLFDYVARQFGKGAVTFFRAGYYLPQILPVAIAGVVWGWILDPNYGALNIILKQLQLTTESLNLLGDPSTALLTVMGIMIWFQIGYPLVIFMAALQRIDPQILEAASMDGASWFQRFTIITAIISPEIGVVVLTTTIYALKLFAQIYVLTRGGPGSATMVPSYFAYQNFFEKSNVGYGALISTIMTVIIVILTAVFINVQSRRPTVEEF